jgi:putative transposase
MDYDPRSHHRRSVRIAAFDYAGSGYYAVTVCTQDKACLFGEVVDWKMLLNDAGRMVQDWFEKLPTKFPNVKLDLFVVMPNHIHFILGLVGADPCVCPAPGNEPNADDVIKQGAHTGAPLPTIVQWFKTMTTNDYFRQVKDGVWKPVRGRLWQRNYYEHVIRNEHDLTVHRDYIVNNPAKWQLDKYNPDNWMKP